MGFYYFLSKLRTNVFFNHILCNGLKGFTCFWMFSQVKGVQACCGDDGNLPPPPPPPVGGNGG